MESGGHGTHWTLPVWESGMFALLAAVSGSINLGWLSYTERFKQAQFYTTFFVGLEV